MNNFEDMKKIDWINKELEKKEKEDREDPENRS